MSIHSDTTTVDGETVVRLTGRVDRDAADVLERAYRDTAAAGSAALDLDFAEVDYINSTGIALIVGVLARCRADGTAVRARGLSSHFQHIFEITRLSDFMTIVEPARRTP